MPRSRKKLHAEARALGKAHYNEILGLQGGVCAVCKRPPYSRAYNVDHDHATLEVRGLLCFLCNYFIARHGVTPETLRAAAAYLEDPPARPLGLRVEP